MGSGSLGGEGGRDRIMRGGGERVYIRALWRFQLVWDVRLIYLADAQAERVLVGGDCYSRGGIGESELQVVLSVIMREWALGDWA